MLQFLPALLLLVLHGPAGWERAALSERGSEAIRIVSEASADSDVGSAELEAGQAWAAFWGGGGSGSEATRLLAAWLGMAPSPEGALVAPDLAGVECRSIPFDPEFGVGRRTGWEGAPPRAGPIGAA